MKPIGALPLFLLSLSILEASDVSKEAKVRTAMKRDGVTSFTSGCEVIRSQKAFETRLEALGWSKYGNRFPEVDFTRELAIVIAPSYYQDGSDLSLSKLVVDEQRSKLVLFWHFAKRAAARIDGNSASFGSEAPAGLEILSVTVPLSVVGEMEIACQNSR